MPRKRRAQMRKPLFGRRRRWRRRSRRLGECCAELVRSPGVEPGMADRHVEDECSQVRMSFGARHRCLVHAIAAEHLGYEGAVQPVLYELAPEVVVFPTVGRELCVTADL